MIYYSHRGNLSGPAPELENSPKWVDRAIRAGFQVEVDLRCVGSEYYLGHDFPQHKVSMKWLEARQNKLLFHIKSFEVLNLINGHGFKWHYFCHARDPWVLTSQGYVWLHTIERQPTERTIMPLISRDLLDSCPYRNIYGVCTNYPTYAVRKFK